VPCNCSVESPRLTVKVFFAGAILTIRSFGEASDPPPSIAVTTSPLKPAAAAALRPVPYDPRVVLACRKM